MGGGGVSGGAERGGRAGAQERSFREPSKPDTPTNPQTASRH